MRYESKFKTFFRKLGLFLGVVLMAGGIFLASIPTQEAAAKFGTFLIAPNKDIVYNDTPIIIPDFIPYSQIETYLKYEPYTKEHISLTAYYCPNSEHISHRDGYCAACDPEITLLKYQKGLHAPKGVFRNLFKSVRLSNGDTVVIQQIR